ncbi:MAG: hypothetical protein ACR2LV_03365 [Solirubrobacteraceae bacterium]
MVLGIAPALSPGKAAPYVIGAYIVFLALVLVYFAIMATRLSRTERDLAELRRDIQARDARESPGDAAGHGAESDEPSAASAPAPQRERVG